MEQNELKFEERKQCYSIHLEFQKTNLQKFERLKSFEVLHIT